MKISTILDKIDERQLFVPAFQREYVWKREDAKQLLDSLIKTYPTGTMLTWETNNPPELKGHHKYDEKQGAVRILLDGQQRITTLYMLIRGEIPHYYTAPEITNDTRNLHVNVETLELEYYSKQKMENYPCWRNITEVFQRKVRARDIIRQLEEKGELVDRAREDRLDDNMRAIENILDREFPEQTIPIKATMRSHAFVDHTDEINSIYALVPIIVYCFDKGNAHLTDVEIGKIVKWFYYSQVRARYVSQLPQKLDRDLRLIAEAKSPFDELLAVIAEERRLEITADEFEGRSISHPLFGLMCWYFKKRGAICFTTGLSIRQTMGKQYQLEDDHIFPFSRLKKAGYGKESRVKYSLAQELTNRAILTKVANRCKIARNFDPTFKVSQRIDLVAKYWNWEVHLSRPIVTPPEKWILTSNQ